MLIFRFHPFNKKTGLTKDDKNMIFSSGIYLLLTTTVGDYLVAYKDKITDKVKNVIVDK